MAPSTSHVSPDADPFALPALERFYRWNAPIYDWTRPTILWGRHALLRGLDVYPGAQVLDVGCGTGWSLPHLLAAGASVTAVEPSASMRARARARVQRIGGGHDVAFDDAPFGGDDRHRGRHDRVLFCYSLSMIPPALRVLTAARESLHEGGQIGVVDFLDALPGVRQWLEVSHVRLGYERLRLLQVLFPNHRYAIRRGPLWRYYVFWGGLG